jgi:hypothetical protein
LLTSGPWAVVEPELCGPSVADSHLLWVLQRKLLNMVLVVFNKIEFLICVPPIGVKGGSFFLIDVVVVVGFLDVVPYFFLHYLAAFVVQHSLLSNAVDSLVVFVGLLLLGYCVPLVVLPHVVLKVVLLDHSAIGTHFR